MIQRRNEVQGNPGQRAVIFDFDGTIADSLPAIIAVFEDLTGRSERFTTEQIEAMRELSIPQLMQELKVPKWKAPYLVVRGRQMLKAHLHGIHVHEAMADAIKELHERAIPLYVLSSNSTENVRSYLRWHKLERYFSGVYGGASIWGKAPRLLKLIEEMGVDVAHSWYVGDETRDVTAARAVGLNVASVTWGYNTRAALEAKGPDAVVDTAAELLSTLKVLWKK